MMIIEIPKNSKLLTESFLTSWGTGVRLALRKMFDLPVRENVIFRGRKTDIDSLYKTLASEKKYAEAYMSLGLANPELSKHKVELETQIEKFEKQTGVKWPIL